eukprot:1194897-Prorocentrum_minimum.AAC.8
MECLHVLQGHSDKVRMRASGAPNVHTGTLDVHTDDTPNVHAATPNVHMLRTNAQENKCALGSRQ